MLTWSRYPASLLVAALAVTSWTPIKVAAQQSFADCGVDTYYQSLNADPSTWTLADLKALTEEKHRNTLPIQLPGQDDVYQALIDLWPGDTPGETVHLVYRDLSDYPSTPYANSQTWSRGNIWPEDRRSGFPEMANADIHANVPADTTVFSSKVNSFFGECGTVQAPELCEALPEAPETFTDDKIWQIPDSAKGSQARMAFYMAAAYGDATSLSDCPPFSANQFGYLSPLLEWHADNPPTQEEQDRNTRACVRWQGTRNPFVDYPQLVEQFWGQPDTIREGFRSYNRCFENDSIATSAPTAAPNACQDMEAGDIQLILENSDAPDQMTFFTLDNIPHAVERIYVTDKPWNGTHLLDNGEGTLYVSTCFSKNDSKNDGHRTQNQICNISFSFTVRRPSRIDSA